MLIIPDLVLMQEPQHLCSNRAVTRVNILKCWEMCYRPNAAIYRNSASPEILDKRSHCLRTAEDAGSIPASPTL